MKKMNLLFIGFLSTVLVSGCSYGPVNYGTGYGGSSSSSSPSSSSSQPASNSNSSAASFSSVASSSGSAASSSMSQGSSSASVKTGTLQQTLVDIQSALKPRTGVVLPHKIVVRTGKFISATAKNTATGYTVSFKQTNSPLKVNDPQLAGAPTVAKFIAAIYPTTTEAGKQISFHKYGATDGRPVNLGHRITGYADAAAGTAGVSWNEGRWTLMALSPTSDAQKGQALAKQVVNYLEVYFLPVPHQYGIIQVYTDNRQDYALWQNGRTVYQLTGTSSAMNLLAATVSVH